MKYVTLKTKDEESLTKDFCSTQFGEVLFGEFKQFYKKEKEKDTLTEKEVFNHIKRFIGGEFVEKEKDAKLEKALLDLRKCISKYPKVLKPNKLTLYRGLTLPIKEVSKLKFNPKKPIDLNGTKFVPAKYVYKGKSIVQSWTPNIKSALEFAITSADSKRHADQKWVQAILKKKFSSSDPLLFNTNFLNSLTKVVDFVDEEDEIIRIEKSPLNSIVYIPFENYKLLK